MSRAMESCCAMDIFRSRLVYHLNYETLSCKFKYVKNVRSCWRTLFSKPEAPLLKRRMTQGQLSKRLPTSESDISAVSSYEACLFFATKKSYETSQKIVSQEISAFCIEQWTSMNQFRRVDKFIQYISSVEVVLL